MSSPSRRRPPAAPHPLGVAVLAGSAGGAAGDDAGDDAGAASEPYTFTVTGVPIGTAPAAVWPCTVPALPGGAAPATPQVTLGIPAMAALASASVLPTTSGMVSVPASPPKTWTAVPAFGTTVPWAGDWDRMAPTSPGLLVTLVDLLRLSASPFHPLSWRIPTA